MRVSPNSAVLGVFLALALGACSTTPDGLTATTSFDPGFNFSQVHKIAIQPISRDKVSTVMISDTQISRIDQALTVELQRRGIQVVAENTEADMFLVWHLVTDAVSGASAFNTTRYDCWECVDDGDPFRVRVTEGTFSVEMVDPVTLRAKWRSVFVSRLHEQPGSVQAAEFRRQAAEVILAKFPPNKAAP